MSQQSIPTLPAESAPSDSAVAGTSWRDFPPLELPPILRVALGQIVAVGYHATTVRSISKELGVTVPALYYHYENKQAILVALLDTAMNIVHSHTTAALEEAGDDPADRLAALVESIVLYMAHYRDLAFLDSERRALTPENFDRYIAQRDLIEQQLRSTVTKGHDDGVFNTEYPKESARAILSMCQGISGWFRSKGRKGPEEIAQQYTKFALATVGYSAKA